MTSTASISPSRALRLMLVTLIFFGLSAAAGCAHSPTDQSIEDQGDLQLTVQTFHRDMRWMRWEAAAMVVAPDKRDAFLARYEELGDDFHISNIEIKSLEHLKTEVLVDLEQESYTEPAMIVKKRRYIEVWKKSDGDWYMTRRMLKDDFKKMKKLEAAQELRKKRAPRDTPDPDAPGVADDANLDTNLRPTEREDAPSID